MFGCCQYYFYGDKSGKISLLNRKGCEILGCSEAEVLGKDWFEFAVPANTRAQVLDSFQRLMQGSTDESLYYTEYEIKNSETGISRLIAWHNAVVTDENGQPQASIKSGIDITEHRAAEERIIRLNAELEERVEQRTEELASAVNQLLDTNKQLKREVQERQAVENTLRENEQEIRKALEREKELSELKSRFVSMASHEFRTPLSTILSSADLIEAYKKEEQQEKRERHTNRIKAAVVNLTNILNDFLSLSRLEEGKIEVNQVHFNLREFCNETFDEINVLLKTGQSIIRKELLQYEEIVLDAKLLKNILFNLLSNAIKYSEPGKPIHCTMEVIDNQLKITIADQGIGIPEEEQQHLFSPFFRAHNVENIQGTGLGLNIVQRYVDLLQGTISFESKLSEGTTFYVNIPLKSIPVES
ncbi:MAG: ATP-binding protein [Saprospiraceae bacterium]